jgi:Circularly permutated YpsA SLOG family
MGAIGRVISGGQSGVDRAALDSAIELGLPYGGWCPHGGWAEDLNEPPGLLALYPHLRATPALDPAQRTRWNVRDSDATLILVPGGRAQAGSGTALTIAAAGELCRPIAVIDLDEAALRERAPALLAELPPGAVLNVAGPRESGVPGIYRSAREVLTALLGSLSAT